MTQTTAPTVADVLAEGARQPGTFPLDPTVFAVVITGGTLSGIYVRLFTRHDRAGDWLHRFAAAYTRDVLEYVPRWATSERALHVADVLDSLRELGLTVTLTETTVDLP